MPRLRLKPPQPRRQPIRSLVEAAKPNLKPRLTHRNFVPAGGWRRFGGPPPASCGGWWDQIGVRPCRPERIVPRCGCLRSALNNRLPKSGLNNRVSRSLGARLSRLSRPPSLPGSVKRHLPHLTHAVLRSPGDHQRLVDPRLELVQRRNRAAGYDPVVRVVSLRSLDTRENTSEEGGKSALLLDLRPPFPRTETRGAP